MDSYFIVGQLSDQGKREYQEDAYVVQLNLADPGLAQRKGVLFLVADGVGGLEAGATASALACEVIPQRYFNDPNTAPVESLREAILAANQAIYRAAAKMGSHTMATTVAVAVVVRDQLCVGHVGDSRVYLWHGRRLHPLTQDHSWVAEQVRKGLLDVQEAAGHPYRNVITRALGTKPEVVPDVRSVGQLTDGDRLVLCTDGLYDVVEASQIAIVLEQFAPPEACRELADMAIALGGTDNVTVIVAEYHGAPQPGAILEPPGGLERDQQSSGACVIRFRHAASPEAFEAQQALEGDGGRSVVCGITVSPHFYEGRYPIAMRVWIESATSRASHLLVGKDVCFSTSREEPQSELLEVVSGVKMVVLSIGELAVRVTLPEIKFAGERNRYISKALVRFERVDADA